MKIPVAVLGATGVVGQQYVRLLTDHPWFELRVLTASEASVGKCSPLSDIALTRIGELLDACPLVFSCLSGPDVRGIEELYAKAGVHVIANTSAHRRDPDVPLIIPEVNPDHLQVIEQQKWKGSIVCKPNCSIQSYLLPLAPLHQAVGLKSVLVTTLQAMSGAGAGAEMKDNILPLIPGEEEKGEWEPRKILGSLTPDGIELNDTFQLSSHCNRVPTAHGHMACVSVAFQGELTEERMREMWEESSPLELPSAPPKPIIYCDDEDRPQPEQDLRDGMSVTVGRLRECNVLDHRFVGLSHNLIRGAAGGGVLTAELMFTQGYLS